MTTLIVSPQALENAPLSTSISEKQQRLDKVRGDFIRAEILGSSPISLERPLEIINGYLGFDEGQYAEVSKSLYFSFVDQIPQLKDRMENGPWISEEQRSFLRDFSNGFLTTVQEQLSSLPFGRTVEVMSLDKNQSQLVALKLFRSIYFNLDKFSDKFKEEDQNAVQSFIQIFKSCSIDELLHPSCREDLTSWVREIVSCQGLFRKLLPSIVLEKGASKGFLFVIKKDGKTRGYLFGTIHYLTTPAMQKAAQVTEVVQKCLCESSILGTEKASREHDPLVSVDRRLEVLAESRGIVNFGIDGVVRSELEKDLQEKVLQESVKYVKEQMDLLADPKATKKNDSDELSSQRSNSSSRVKRQKFEQAAPKKEEPTTSLDPVIEAYCSGDIKTFLQLRKHEKIPDGFEKEKFININHKRNQEMALNIDALLKACEKAGAEMHVETPKCFFAVGAAHLLFSKIIPESVVDILSKMKWELQFEK